MVVRAVSANAEDVAIAVGAALRHAVKRCAAEGSSCPSGNYAACRAAGAGKGNKVLVVRTVSADAEDVAIAVGAARSVMP